MDDLARRALDATRAAERWTLRGRRWLFLALVGTSFALALAAMARILGGDGLGAGDVVLLLCFAAMLP